MQFPDTFYDSEELKLMADALNAACINQRSHHEPDERPLLAAMTGQIMTAVSRASEVCRARRCEQPQQTLRAFLKQLPAIAARLAPPS
jgi:hypothetical protein